VSTFTRRALIALGAGAWAGATGWAGSSLAWPHDHADDRPPPAAPAGEEIDLAGHVLNRLTFGTTPAARAELLTLGPTVETAVDAWIAQQLAVRDDDDAAARSLHRFAAIDAPIAELYEFKPEVLRAELAGATLLRAVHARRQLYEVLVQFWSDHLNVAMAKGECAWLKPADDRLVARQHACGRFRDLIAASALSPAMLWYLDGRENRRRTAAEKPNENYARELLELHTLGVDGGYSQRDVMEVARCLTGWTVRGQAGFRKARVEFHADAHDDGAKEVLGTHIAAGGGRRDLDQVLDVVCAHPATARHLAGKLCTRFIADDPPAAAVAAVAAAFTASGGDLRATVRALFATPEFRSPAIRAGKLKRPFHFVVSCLRLCDARSDGGPALLGWLERMGQAPFQCPTPDGYPEAATAWRDTLLWRWDLAAAFAEGRVNGTRVDRNRLLASGPEALAAHAFGRRANAAERAALHLPGVDPLALILSAPAFQRC